MMLQKIQDLENMFTTEFNAMGKETSQFIGDSGVQLSPEESEKKLQDMEMKNAEKLKALYEIKTVVTDYEEEKEELNIEIMKLRRELRKFEGVASIMEEQGLVAKDVEKILSNN